MSTNLIPTIQYFLRHSLNENMKKMGSKSSADPESVSTKFYVSPHNRCQSILLKKEKYCTIMHLMSDSPLFGDMDKKGVMALGTD